MSKKIGRNDPCPCGSGKKYKKCCGLKDNSSPSPTTAMGEIADDAIRVFLDRYIEEQNPKTPQEFQNVINDFFDNALHSGRYRVDAVSYDDIKAMIFKPYNSPQIVQFPEILEVDADALIIDIFDLFVRSVRGEGLKATANGNLSRKTAREAQEMINKRSPAFHPMPPERIFREHDVMLLDITRVVAEIAGLIKLNKKKKCFSLTKKAEELLAIPNYRAVYPVLMKSYITEYNWAYGDGAEEILPIQESAVFSLYLITRSGGAWKNPYDYADDIIEHFPAILDEIKPTYTMNPRKVFAYAYYLRIFDRFGRLFNLVDFKKESNTDRLAKPLVKAGPMIDHVCKFIVNSQYL